MVDTSEFFHINWEESSQHIPTNELIFFRGVGQPPTRNGLRIWMSMVYGRKHASVMTILCRWLANIRNFGLFTWRLQSPFIVGHQTSGINWAFGVKMTGFPKHGWFSCSPRPNLVCPERYPDCDPYHPIPILKRDQNTWSIQLCVRNVRCFLLIVHPSSGANR